LNTMLNTIKINIKHNFIGFIINFIMIINIKMGIDFLGNKSKSKSKSMHFAPPFEGAPT